MIESAVPTDARAGGDCSAQSPANLADRWQAGLLNVADALGPVSHELHNVMNNIVLHAALLAREAPESLRQQVTVFKSLAFQASRMLTELDDVRHAVRSPQQALQIADVLQPILERYAQQGVALDGECEPVPPISGNEADVRRLLELLIAGAHAAGPPVSIHLSRGAGQERGVTLRVADHGADVPPEKIDQLFEPFAVTREGENSLERTACRVIARRLGAKWNAAANPGGGVVVTIEFQPAAR